MVVFCHDMAGLPHRRQHPPAVVAAVVAAAAATAAVLKVTFYLHRRCLDDLAFYHYYTP